MAVRRSLELIPSTFAAPSMTGLLRRGPDWEVVRPAALIADEFSCTYETPSTRGSLAVILTLREKSRRYFARPKPHLRENA